LLIGTLPSCASLTTVVPYPPKACAIAWIDHVDDHVCPSEGRPSTTSIGILRCTSITSRRTSSVGSRSAAI
jgi:hypothetical protein